MAEGGNCGAEQRLLVLEMPVDAKLGYLRPLGDLVYRRRLETQFHKELTGCVDNDLSKRLIHGPSTAGAVSGHDNLVLDSTLILELRYRLVS